MTTVLTVITDAGAACGGIDPQESLSDAMAQFCLRRFNRMVESWSNEQLLIYNVYIDSLALAANTASYSSTLLANGRPMSVDSIIVRLSNVDTDVMLISNQDYQSLQYKTTAGLPDRCYVSSGFPNTDFFFFPVPNQSYTAYVSCRGILMSTAVLTTTLSFPPGYEKAFVDCLAMDIAGPAFGLQVMPELRESAVEAKATIKRANYAPLYMDCGVPTRPGLFNIYSGNNGRN